MFSLSQGLNTSGLTKWEWTYWDPFERNKPWQVKTWPGSDEEAMAAAMWGRTHWEWHGTFLDNQDLIIEWRLSTTSSPGLLPWLTFPVLPLLISPSRCCLHLLPLHRQSDTAFVLYPVVTLWREYPLPLLINYFWRPFLSPAKLPRDLLSVSQCKVCKCKYPFLGFFSSQQVASCLITMPLTRTVYPYNVITTLSPKACTWLRILPFKWDFFFFHTHQPGPLYRTAKPLSKVQQDVQGNSSVHITGLQSATIFGGMGEKISLVAPNV